VREARHLHDAAVLQDPDRVEVRRAVGRHLELEIIPAHQAQHGVKDERIVSERDRIAVAP
jgi:hypothetical protein